MSGPQVEDGNFTRIHNEILEHLALGKFTSYEHKCLWFLFRQTYGYQAKDKAISLSLWEVGTGIEKRNLSRTLNKLVERNIIYRRDKRGRSNIAVYGFNKYFATWDKKVCEHTPLQKVCENTPFGEEKVCEHTPKKVYVHTPNKERKKTTASLLDASPSENALALVRLCWDSVGLFPNGDENARNKNLAIADELIERYGWAACEGRLPYLNQQAQNKRIRSPVAYLRTCMQDEQPQEQQTQIDVTLEEIL